MSYYEENYEENFDDLETEDLDEQIDLYNLSGSYRNKKQNNEDDSDDDYYDENDYYDEDENSMSSKKFYESCFSDKPDTKINYGKTYDFKEIMEYYHSDDPSLQEIAKEQAIASLTGIIHLIIEQHYVTYKIKYMEDLLSEGKVGILKGLKTYDPDRSKPSTFFYPYIMHELQSFIDSSVNKTTAHYSSNIRKINRVINELTAENIPYDEIMIASMTNLTMETVRQAMAIRNYRDEINYDGSTESFINNNTANPVKSPEEVYIEEEKNKVIHSVIDNKLNEYEKAIIEYSFGLNNAPICSHKEMSRRLNLPIDKIKKYHASALRKLRCSDLKMIYSDYLKKDEGFTLENDVPVLPIQAALDETEMFEGIEINF